MAAQQIKLKQEEYRSKTGSKKKIKEQSTQACV
jgi:hypothetical protein